jgi:hypothetical protein
MGGKQCMEDTYQVQCQNRQKQDSGDGGGGFFRVCVGGANLEGLVVRTHAGGGACLHLGHRVRLPLHCYSCSLHHILCDWCALEERHAGNVRAHTRYSVIALL